MIRARLALPLLLAALLEAAACSKSPAAKAPPATTSPDASIAVTDDDAGACTSPEFTGSPLGVHCNALVDTSGRTVLLHGVNARVSGIFDITFDDGRLPLETIPAFTIDDATRIRALGFNALRLPVDWSGIEPEADGGIVTAYLDRVAAVTAMCAKAGVFVLIDFHQDGYSKEVGEDGAPLWAIDPPPTQLLGGPLGDLGARIESPQVQNAYVTFFASDAGAPLRARYAQMAATVAARFANDPAVVGFELYNEPIATADQAQALHEQMIPALRTAAPSKLVFFEPPAFRNEIDSASLGSGSIGAGTVYAPHVYTLAFTNPDESVTKDTYAHSNESARDEADSWEAPLVITEYGYPPSSPNFMSWAKWQAELEDEVKASSFFWVWKEESQGSWGFYDYDGDAGTLTERAAVVKAMTRARLEAVAGALVSVGYDEDAMTMTVTFDGSDAVHAPNVVSIGAGASVPAAKWIATCDGKSVSTGDADPLAIACGGAGAHTLVVSAK